MIRTYPQSIYSSYDILRCHSLNYRNAWKRNEIDKAMEHRANYTSFVCALYITNFISGDQQSKLNSILGSDEDEFYLKAFFKNLCPSAFEQ